MERLELVEDVTLKAASIYSSRWGLHGLQPSWRWCWGKIYCCFKAWPVGSHSEGSGTLWDSTLSLSAGLPAHWHPGGRGVWRAPRRRLWSVSSCTLCREDHWPAACWPARPLTPALRVSSWPSGTNGCVPAPPLLQWRGCKISLALSSLLLWIRKQAGKSQIQANFYSKRFSSKTNISKKSMLVIMSKLCQYKIPNTLPIDFQLRSPIRCLGLLAHLLDESIKLECWL